MSFSQPFIERPIGTTLLAIGLFLVGAVAYFSLPVASLPAVEFRQADVHQDQVRRFRVRQRDPLEAVGRLDHDVILQLQAPGQHVAVHVVIFDKEDLAAHGFLRG